MKLIKPSIELLEQGPGLQGVYDMIELCGKTSYKSPVKGGKVAEDFVSARVNEGHYAVLEFGTVYLKYPVNSNNPLTTDIHFAGYYKNPYSSVRRTENNDFAITTNLRVLVENGWLSDLQYLCEPTEFHAKRYAARIITDRGVTHELVRHRTFSFCQESTRYCNYSKDKFGNELNIIIPSWCNLIEGNSYDMTVAKMCGISEDISPQDQRFLMAMCFAEEIYIECLEDGWTPQQARQVLPNALKTEICVCGFKDAWEHFFRLRTSLLAETGKPHPDMSYLADTLYTEFVKKRFIEPLV